MSQARNGQLVPTGGGDPIPLLRKRLVIGRREECDICLQFPNISGEHCELTFANGYWTVRDLGSTNGTKVNGERVQSRPLRPGDEISLAKRRYLIQYEVSSDTRRELEDAMSESEDIFSQSLMEKAGLETRKRPRDDE